MPPTTGARQSLHSSRICRELEGSEAPAVGPVWSSYASYAELGGGSAAKARADRPRPRNQLMWHGEAWMDQPRPRGQLM